MADQGTVEPSTGDQGTGSGRQVFRTPGSVVLCWAWLVVAVLILGSVALRGHNHAGAVAALVVIAITGCMYACAWQPRIVADADGITVQNPLRWHILPWAVVTQVDLAQTVQVHHTGSPGGVPGPHRAQLGGAVLGRVPDPGRVAGQAQRPARRPHRAPLRGRGHRTGYGQPPDAVTAARQGSAAEFVTRQLNERLEAAQPAGGGQRSRRSGPARISVARVRWAWWQIAAIVVPLAGPGRRGRRLTWPPGPG